MKRINNRIRRSLALVGSVMVFLWIFISLMPAFGGCDGPSARHIISGFSGSGFNGFPPGFFSPGPDNPLIMQAASPVQSLLRGIRQNMQREKLSAFRVSARNRENATSPEKCIFRRAICIITASPVYPPSDKGDGEPH